MSHSFLTPGAMAVEAVGGFIVLLILVLVSRDWLTWWQQRPRHASARSTQRQTQRLASATGKPVQVVQRMSGRTGRVWIASHTTVTPAIAVSPDEQPTVKLPPVITQSYPRVELPTGWANEWGWESTFDAYAGGGSHLPVPYLPPQPALSEEDGLERTRQWVFAEEDAAAWAPFCLACGAPMPCLAHLSWHLARERRIDPLALELVLPSLWEHLEREVVPFVNQN